MGIVLRLMGGGGLKRRLVRRVGRKLRRVFRFGGDARVAGDDVLARKVRDRAWIAETNLQAMFPGYSIGRYSYGNPAVLFADEGRRLVVGQFCSIAEGVQIFLGGEHRVEWVTSFPFNVVFESAWGIEGHPRSKGDVVIGHDVWIGMEAVVMSGVTIGNGAVIGARAVVARDVPAYGIVAGNPARLVRMRFDDETIARLQAVAWWDWDEARIERFVPLLLSGDVAGFLRAAGG